MLRLPWPDQTHKGYFIFILEYSKWWIEVNAGGGCLLKKCVDFWYPLSHGQRLWCDSKHIIITSPCMKYIWTSLSPSESSLDLGTFCHLLCKNYNQNQYYIFKKLSNFLSNGLMWKKREMRIALLNHLWSNCLSHLIGGSNCNLQTYNLKGPMVWARC